MRFGIRDLLLAMTIVAAYTVGFCYLARLGDQSMRRGEWRLGLVMLTTMAITTLWIGHRSHRRAGEPLVAWQSLTWWAPQAIFLSVFLGYLGFCTWRDATLGIALPLMMAFQQFAFLFNQRIQLSREGLLLGLAFIPWDECELAPVEGETFLELSAAGRLLPPRWPIKKHRVPMPLEEREAILAALAEIQGDDPSA